MRNIHGGQRQHVVRKPVVVPAVVEDENNKENLWLKGGQVKEQSEASRRQCPA
jgi:hypothetical protein